MLMSTIIRSLHYFCRYVLDKILKSSAKDEVVDNIHGYLRGMADDIRQGKVPLKKFAITKVLKTSLLKVTSTNASASSL